jgi:hypothetical protein
VQRSHTIVRSRAGLLQIKDYLAIDDFIRAEDRSPSTAPDSVFPEEETLETGVPNSYGATRQ